MKRKIVYSTAVLLIAAFMLFAGGSRESQSDTGEPDYRQAGTLQSLIENQDRTYLLVDVRTPQEFASGYIPSSVNIPVEVIASRPPEVPKDSLVILYCRSGIRSNQARRILSDLGYTNITDFGGISRWPYALVSGD